MPAVLVHEEPAADESMSQEARERQRDAAEGEKKSKRGWLLGIFFIVLV